MTKFLQKSFSVGGASTDAYRDNYERIFSKKPALESVEPLPDPLQRDLKLPSKAFREVLVRLPEVDFEALKLWATEYKDESPLDPDVAHTVLMAVADAVSSP